jgi:hypothetical protein
MSVQVTSITSRGGRLAATVAVPGVDPIELYLEANVDLVDDATPWVTAQIPLAMRYAEPLHVDGTVDPVTISNAAKAQEVLHGWYPRLSLVEVTATHLAERTAAPGVGCFFSGGVDSFYSVLRHLDRITHLVFVHGFDIPIDNVDLGERARVAAREAALALGKPLIEVSTNVRQLSNTRVEWQTEYHGAALASVGHALADLLGELIIPGSYAEADLHPWGTHPDLDKWWSGSGVTFEHDAVDVTRPEKVRALAQHQVALDHLRVCFKNKNNAYNCGRCEKCLRTMIALASAGALEQCKTLPGHVDARTIRRMGVNSEAAHLFVTENIRAIEALPAEARDEELLKALKVARGMGYVRRPLRAVGRPVMRRVVRPVRRRWRHR